MATSALPSNYTLERRVSEDASRGVKLIVSCLVFSIIFINAADFRGDTGEKFSVHWQIYLRLLNCAVCGLMGMILLHRSFLPYFQMPGLLMSGLIVWIGVSCVFSIDRSYSIASFISLGCIALLTPAAMKVLGPFLFLLSAGIGFVLFLVGSWITYIVFPDIGVFKEQISNTEVFERMGGLGHPNELGFYSANTVVLFSALHYCRRISVMFALPVILLAFVTLATCFSRTSLLLTFVGLITVYRQEIFTGKFVVAALLIALTVMPVGSYFYATGELDWFIADLGDKVSKSGSSDELSTATGRTEIWSYAIQKISEEPLKGYGYGTQRFVMKDHSYHCHNIFLNYCMSSGILGGLLFLSMALFLLYGMWQTPRPEIDGLVMMILVGGFAEGLLIAPAPTAPMLFFLAGLFWRQIGMNIYKDQPGVV